jgi:hypothetical protein
MLLVQFHFHDLVFGLYLNLQGSAHCMP